MSVTNASRCVLRSAPILIGGIAFAGDEVVPFTSEAFERGIQYTMQQYPPLFGYSGFGMAFADLDLDGDEDLVLLGRSNGLTGFFENDGSGTFLNRTFDVAMFPLTEPSVVLAFDYDGDRDLDLFIGQYLGDANRLYRQDAPWTFTDVSEEAGIAESLPTKGASVADFDGDGWLDLYTCQYIIPGAGDSIRNRLYRNRGDGTFERVGAAWGAESPRASLQSIWSNTDGDTWPDLYLSNDRGPFTGPNQLFRNEEGVLVEISESSGADASLFSMGIAAGDLNRDGRPDFYLTNIADPVPPLLGANPLLVSRPDGTWEERQELWGVAHHTLSWAAILWDFDNDTDLDLYVNDQFDANNLYLNPGSPPMTDVTASADLGGTAGASYVSIVGDVDGDGDLDMVQNNHGDNVALYINHHGDVRNWLRVRIVGEHPNHHAIGATARCRTGTLRQWAEVRVGGNGYLGQSETVLHFGMGPHDRADEITVRWPNGGPVRVLADLPAGELWTAYPPSRLGDVDGDGLVDTEDWAAFGVWGLGPLEPGREMLDFDGDGTLGSADVEAFWGVASGRRGDLDGDGAVGGSDLAAMLASWGSSQGEPASTADLDLDGMVNGADLTILLGQWGRAK